MVSRRLITSCDVTRTVHAGGGPVERSSDSFAPSFSSRACVKEIGELGSCVILVDGREEYFKDRTIILTVFRYIFRGTIK